MRDLGCRIVNCAGHGRCFVAYNSTALNPMHLIGIDTPAEVLFAAQHWR
jgi:hypothetical protein